MRSTGTSGCSRACTKLPSPRPPEGPARHLLHPRAGALAPGPRSGPASGRLAAPEPCCAAQPSAPCLSPGGTWGAPALCQPAVAQAGRWRGALSRTTAPPILVLLGLVGCLSCSSSAPFATSLLPALSLRRSLSFSRLRALGCWRSRLRIADTRSPVLSLFLHGARGGPLPLPLFPAGGRPCPGPCRPP